MDLEEIENLFARWFYENYGIIPGSHSRTTHAAFAQWFAEQTAPPQDAA